MTNFVKNCIILNMNTYFPLFIGLLFFGADHVQAQEMVVDVKPVLSNLKIISDVKHRPDNVAIHRLGKPFEEDLVWWVPLYVSADPTSTETLLISTKTKGTVAQQCGAVSFGPGTISKLKGGVFSIYTTVFDHDGNEYWLIAAKFSKKPF